MDLDTLLSKRVESVAKDLHDAWAKTHEEQLEQLKASVQERCAALVARQQQLEAAVSKALNLTDPLTDGPLPDSAALLPAAQQEVANVKGAAATGQAEEAPARPSLLAVLSRRTAATSSTTPTKPPVTDSDWLEEPEDRFQTEEEAGRCWDAVREPGIRNPPLPTRVPMVLAWLLLLLLCAILAALYRAPWLVGAVVLALLVWLLYFFAERPVIRIVTARAKNGGYAWRLLFESLARVLLTVQGLRSSRSREHQIRALLATLTTLVILFNPDVGAVEYIQHNFEFQVAPFGLAVFVLFTTLLYHQLLSCRERGIRRLGSFEDLALDLSVPRGSEEVQATLRKIQMCFKSNLSVWHRRSGANSVRDDLNDLDDAALNELLTRIPLNLLMQTLGRIEGAVALLCMDRAEDLSVHAKSRLLHTLMRMQLTSCGNAEAAVENLLLTTRGDGLSLLKCMADGRGDVHSIRKLVFQDIRSREVRTRILDHFLAEGLTQVVHRTLMASGHFQWLMRQAKSHSCVPRGFEELHLARREGEEEEEDDDEVNVSYDGSADGQHFGSWLKIIFDIDDTLMSSGGRQPAGIDTSYPRHAVYPGFTALLRELQGEGTTSHLVALSARPHIVGDVVERGVFQRFRRLMDTDGLPTMPDLLPGALDTGIEFMMSGGGDSGMRALARKKFESFSQYLELYPEFRIVFFGDNGQGDYAVAREMHRRFPNNLEQVWIHTVQPAEDTPFYSAEVEGPIEFTDDYVMAAISAATRPVPLITPQGLRRVVLAAAESFARIEGWQSNEQRDKEEKRLSASLAQAKRVLQDFGISEEWMEEGPESPQGTGRESPAAPAEETAE